MCCDNELACLNRCRLLLHSYHASTVNFVWFTDDKLLKYYQLCDKRSSQYMLPSSVDTVEVGCGRRRLRDGGGRQRDACVGDVATDDGSDDVSVEPRG